MLNAVVIPFPERAPPVPQANADVHGSAQIIIFPGVRYIHLREDIEDLFAIATAPIKSPSKGKR